MRSLCAWDLQRDGRVLRFLTKTRFLREGDSLGLQARGCQGRALHLAVPGPGTSTTPALRAVLEGLEGKQRLGV